MVSYYAGVGLDSRYYPVTVLEICSTDCYPVLESSSTAVAGVRLNGGNKSAALQFDSFERREDTPDRSSNLT